MGRGAGLAYNKRRRHMRHCCGHCATPWFVRSMPNGSKAFVPSVTDVRLQPSPKLVFPTARAATICARVGRHENDPSPTGPWRSHSRSVSSLPATQVNLEHLTGSPSSRSWRSPHSQQHQPPARILGFARITFSKLAISKERLSRTCVVWHWEAAYRSLNFSSLPMRIFGPAGILPSPTRRLPDDSVIRARNFRLLYPSKWNSILNLVPSESTLRGSMLLAQRLQSTAPNFSMK